MYKSLKNNNKFAEGNSIVFRFLNVIVGRVLVILLQQVTNQVNKFAILFKRSMLSQDCRNASGNDGCWRRLLSTCCKFIKRMYHPGSSANELTLKAKDDYKSVLQYGRSMIEMLGVLAIIAVLSVGGIAGYSKAMEKFKVNKLLDEYSMLLYGLLGNVREFRNQSWADSRSQVGLIDYAKATSLVPETWKKVNNTRMTDSQGNVILLFSRSNRLVMDIYIGGVVNEKTGTMTYSTGYNATVCRELMQNFAKPLHGEVQFVSFYRWTDGEYANLYRGDEYCAKGEKCLRDITLTEINDLCKSCEGDKEACCINIEF